MMAALGRLALIVARVVIRVIGPALLAMCIGALGIITAILLEPMISAGATAVFWWMAGLVW